MTRIEYQALLQDYEKTQALVDKLDGFLFWVRNWTIIAVSTIIAFSISNGCSWLILANIPVVAGFWFVELIWKSFHEDAIKHTWEVEEIIQSCVFSGGKIPPTYQFGLGHAVEVIKPKKLLNILTAKSRWHNLAFYLLLLGLSLGALVISPVLPGKGPTHIVIENQTDKVPNKAMQVMPDS